jgi:hypothetical protein
VLLPEYFLKLTKLIFAMPSKFLSYKYIFFGVVLSFLAVMFWPVNKKLKSNVITIPADIHQTTMTRILSDTNFIRQEIENKISSQKQVADKLFLLKINNFANTSKLIFSINKKTFISELLCSPTTKDKASVIVNFSPNNYPLPDKDFELFKIFIQEIAQDIVATYGKNEYVYKYKINLVKLYDSTLVSTRTTTKLYPTIDDIYAKIDLLNKYINSQGAKATGSPMLNITRLQDSFTYMVAVPVTKDLKNNGSIISKRMLTAGKFLEIESVKGGFKTTDYAVRMLTNYMDDMGYTSPAIPFAKLITDRAINKDTSAWISNIYYPVF